MILLIKISFFVPYRIAFNEEPGLSSFAFWFDVLEDFYFLVDIFLNFRTEYWGSHGLVQNKRKIATNYLRTWFAIDVISIIPIQYIFIVVNGDRSAGVGDNANKIASESILHNASYSPLQSFAFDAEPLWLCRNIPHVQVVQAAARGENATPASTTP